METNPLGVRKGTWTPEEDILLRKCIESYGEGKWHLVPLRAGLNRCRKSCRLRWLNYLKPNIKRGQFAQDEVDLIIRLHKLLGNRWSLIAGRLPGRTANDVKNFWNSHIEKKAAAETLRSRGQKSITHRPQPHTLWRPETSHAIIDELQQLPPSSHEAADGSCRRWWSNLLHMTLDRPTGLCETCNLNQHGQGQEQLFTDFANDVDIWSLLSFEHEG